MLDALITFSTIVRDQIGHIAEHHFVAVGNHRFYESHDGTSQKNTRLDRRAGNCCEPHSDGANLISVLNERTIGHKT
jgi:hypothetical protein